MSDVIVFPQAPILKERVPGSLADAFAADAWRGDKYYESVDARTPESPAAVAIGRYMREAAGYDSTYGAIGYQHSEVPPGKAQRGSGWHDDNLSFMVTASPFPTLQAVGETDVETIAKVLGEELASQVQGHFDDGKPDFAKDTLVRALRKAPDEVVVSLGFAVSQFMDWSIVGIGEAVHRGGENPYEQSALRMFVMTHHVGILPERAFDASLAAAHNSWIGLARQ